MEYYSHDLVTCEKCKGLYNIEDDEGIFINHSFYICENCLKSEEDNEKVN